MSFQKHRWYLTLSLALCCSSGFSFSKAYIKCSVAFWSWLSIDDIQGFNVFLADEAQLRRLWWRLSKDNETPRFYSIVLSMNCWAAYFFQHMIDEKVVGTSCSVELSLRSSNITLLNSPGLLKFCSSCFRRCVLFPLRFLDEVLNFDEVVRAGWLPQHAQKLRSQRCARNAVTMLNNLIRCHGPGSCF